MDLHHADGEQLQKQNGTTKYGVHTRPSDIIHTIVTPVGSPYRYAIKWNDRARLEDCIYTEDWREDKRALLPLVP